MLTRTPSASTILRHARQAIAAGVPPVQALDEAAHQLGTPCRASVVAMNAIHATHGDAQAAIARVAVERLDIDTWLATYVRGRAAPHSAQPLTAA